jgi:excinuclease UvrABC nuclease subunit
MNITELISQDTVCQSFTTKELQNMLRPCVYIFLRGGVPLYVGSSANGLNRINHNGHHRRHVREMADEVRVVWCKRAHHARMLERRLIKKLEPEFNGRKRPSSRLMSHQSLTTDTKPGLISPNVA